MADASSRHILVINAGSSSVKFTLFDMTSGEDVLARGTVERIGQPGWRLRFLVNGDTIEDDGPETLDHRRALQKVFERLGSDDGPLDGPEDVAAVGHRAVYGGDGFADPVLIDQQVKDEIRRLFPLAPLHNPANYEGIVACEELLPGVPQAAVFDTAFHQTIPERAFLYAIPKELYERDGIRRYGFHGTSHRYVALEAARRLGREGDAAFRLITSHLGNGCSVAAVRGGASVDISLGLTPLEGLVMGTRSGDVDPGVILHLIREKGMSLDEVDRMLNSQSGLLGLAGIGSGDMRDVLAAAGDGNEQARCAVEVYTYRLKKYIGAYMAALNGLDALVFTAGVGENSPPVRRDVCTGLDGLGIVLDPKRNEANEEVISADASTVTVMVIPTNEGLMIARDTLSVISAN